MLLLCWCWIIFNRAALAPVPLRHTKYWQNMKFSCFRVFMNKKFEMMFCSIRYSNTEPVTFLAEFRETKNFCPVTGAATTPDLFQQNSENTVYIAHSLLSCTWSVTFIYNKTYSKKPFCLYIINTINAVDKTTHTKK